MHRGEWEGRTGDSWAAHWQRTDRSFRHVTRALLSTIARHPFATALDVGSGAGELSLELARANRAARIIGVDVSPSLVAAARDRAAQAGLANAAFVQADAASWRPPEGFRAEAVVSRHGVMFFDDPVAGLGAMLRAAAPGAALTFSCFRAMTSNPFFAEVSALLPAPPPRHDPDAPGPFAFADEDKVAGLLRTAGWRDPAFEPLDVAMIAGEGEAAVDEAVAYFTGIGPAARAASAMAQHERRRFEARLRDLAQAHHVAGTVSLPAACWIVTARAA